MLLNKMRIYIICPVRNLTQEWRKQLDEYVIWLESMGHSVHYPPRDTPQEDPTGLGICEKNRKALLGADMIHVAWDGKSEGCLFDLGMAFALKKPIEIIPGFFPPATEGKSFASMVRAWERERRE